MRFIQIENKKKKQKQKEEQHLFGEIIVYDHSVLAVVTEVLAHRTASVRREVLQRRGVTGSGGHDDRVLERVRVLQTLHDLSNCTALLPNCHVDTVQLLLLIAGVVEALLVDDRIHCESSLASLTVADDELTLSATNGYKTVHGFDACTQQVSFL